MDEFPNSDTAANGSARKLILIGTDHRLQQTIAQHPITRAWVPREGRRFRKLIAYCIEKLGAGVILEEVPAEQEKIAPTICSMIAKERHLIWQAISLGEPGVMDGLFDPPITDSFRLGVLPENLAGRYDLNTHTVRESFMHEKIAQYLGTSECVLAVVGYVHLGVLAQAFASEQVNVEALLFTVPLTVDESRA